MGTQADSRRIVKSILSSMKSIFQNSTRGARTRAWDKFCTERGKAEVRRLINNPSMTLNHFDDFLTFKEWIISESTGVVPPAPGTTPVPPGSVRLYHYINLRNGMSEHEAAETLKQQGIDISKARGSTYGEPNLVWGSTAIPNKGKIFVEFFMPMGDPRWGIGKPHHQGDVDWLHKSGADVTFNNSIRPEEIIAVHLPWHETYRYLQENNMIPNVLAGEYDYLLDKPNSNEAKAIQHIKASGGQQ